MPVPAMADQFGLEFRPVLLNDLVDGKKVCICIEN